MSRSKEQSPAEFWREYENKCGEKVLAYTLGQYLGGWAEYEETFWGLVIATEGGFRFHHFPHESWLGALARSAGGGEAPREKTIFITKDRITGVEFRTERSLLKRIFMPRTPRVVVRYLTTTGEDAVITVETGKEGLSVVERLLGLLPS